MSLVIRLRRPGKAVKRRHHYKIVVDQKWSKKEGRFIAQVGYYDPSTKPKIVHLDLEKYAAWVNKGAQPTPTVKALARKIKRSTKKGE